MQRENEKCGEMPKWIEPKVTSQFHSRNEIKHNERPIKLRSELIKLLETNLKLNCVYSCGKSKYYDNLTNKN